MEELELVEDINGILQLVDKVREKVGGEIGIAIEIIVIAAIVVFLIIKISELLQLNQTSLTLMLMEHNEKENYIVRNKAIFYLFCFFMPFLVGIFVPVRLIPFIVGAVICFGLTVFISIVEIKNSNSIIDKIADIIIYIIGFVLFGIQELLIAADMNDKKYISVLLFSLVIAFCYSYGFSNILDANKNKSKFVLNQGNEKRFVFETKGEYLICGDNMDYYKCDHFYLTKMDKNLHLIRFNEEEGELETNTNIEKRKKKETLSNKTGRKQNNTTRNRQGKSDNKSHEKKDNNIEKHNDPNKLKSHKKTNHQNNYNNNKPKVNKPI